MSTSKFGQGFVHGGTQEFRMGSAVHHGWIMRRPVMLQASARAQAIV
jgi:hypothetical protein